MRNNAGIFARNVAANWIGYGISLASGLILSPFLIHRLGDTVYGVWSLVMSLTGYLGLVEIGTRAALGRHVNYYIAQRNSLKVNSLVSTAVVLFLGIGIVIIALAAALGIAFENLFEKVPSEMASTARMVLILVAMNLWLSFFSAVFSQIITAQERFDLYNIVNLAVMILRTAGVMTVVAAGQGLVWMACVHLVTTIAGVLASFYFALRVYPVLVIRWSLVRRMELRELLTFGTWAFIGSMASQLLWSADILIIGWLMGVQHVARFSIALMLIQTGRMLLEHLTTVLVPRTIKSSSTGDLKDVRLVFGWAAKLSMYLGIPMFGGMILLGEEFVSVWMGQSYRNVGPTLVVLAIPQLLDCFARASGGVIWGLNRVPLVAVMSLILMGVKVALTVVLIAWLRMGLMGAAVGTLVPLILFDALTLWLVLRWIQFDMRAFIREYVARWAVACAAMIFAGFCMRGLGLSGWSALIFAGVPLIGGALALMPFILFGPAERAFLRWKIADAATALRRWMLNQKPARGVVPARPEEPT